MLRPDPSGGFVAVHHRHHDVHQHQVNVRVFSQQIQRLLNALDKNNLRERTLVVLITDHGEALGDHGEDEHGGFIYDETVRVAHWALLSGRQLPIVEQDVGEEDRLTLEPFDRNPQVGNTYLSDTLELRLDLPVYLDVDP